MLRAGKTDIRGTEGRFPYLAEFVQDVGNFGLVGVIILLKFYYFVGHNTADLKNKTALLTMKMTARLPVRIISDSVGQLEIFMGTTGGM